MRSRKVGTDVEKRVGQNDETRLIDMLGDLEMWGIFYPSFF